MSDFESRLQEQIKNLVAVHLNSFEQELNHMQESMEALVRSSFNQALASANQGLSGLSEDTSLTSMAREMTEQLAAQAATASQSRATTNLAMLKVSINEIQSYKTQADVLSALVSQASSFSPRVALFIVKSGNAVGWMARGFDGEQGNDLLRGVTISLQSETILRAVLSHQQTFLGEPDAHPENKILFHRLNNSIPTRIASIPLLVRGKAAAVLYADSGSLMGEAINIDALEILVNIAGLTIELISIRPRVEGGPSAGLTQALPGQPSSPTSRHIVPGAVPVVPSISVTPPPPQVSVTPAPIPVSVPIPTPISTPMPAPVVKPVEAYISEPPSMSLPMLAPIVKPVEAYIPEPVAQYAEAAPEAPMLMAVPPMMSANSVSTPNPLPAPPRSVSGGDFAVAFSEEPKVEPKPVAAKPAHFTEEEQKLHNDARRFARLLVSEIKLYNEQKVLDGRKNNDLYDRLKEDMDRSRQMYDKRVSVLVAAKHDYYYDELVATLAGGDAARLGRDCPGPSVKIY